MVVFVADTADKNVEAMFTLMMVTQRVCDKHGTPLVVVGTKVDKIDPENVPDCVSVAQAARISRVLPELPHNAHWLFVHNAGCEDSTVRAEWSPESNGFEAAAFNVLTSISSTLSNNSNKQQQEEQQQQQKDEL